MSTAKSEYDRSVLTWSPQGRLFQLEYAMEAVKLGTTAVGLTIPKDGSVLLVAEKKLQSPLIVPSTMEKIFEIDHHIGCATAGLLADARTLVDHARNEAQNHWFTYNEPLSVESTVNAVADLALNFADHDSRRKKMMSRPFGVAMLIGGIDSDGTPKLMITDPSGTCTKFTAAAIGSASEAATQMLVQQYNSQTMGIKEAEDCGLGIIRQTMEEAMTSVSVQVARIAPAPENKGGKPTFHLYSAAEIDAIVNRLPAPLDL